MNQTTDDERGLAELEDGADRALNGLKDFQRETVEHVCERLYADGGSRRFLVADEVGLGKTLIARGVIARTIQRLRGKVDRIDIVYICSNADIARQNINRLKVPGKHVAFASRLTLLPQHIEEMRRTESGVNLVSFTPGTSFDVHGGLGQIEERLLLLAMLREHWGLGTGTAPMNVFQGNANRENFRQRARAYDLRSIDPNGRSLQAFASVLDARGPDLRARYEQVAEAYSRRGSPGEAARQRSQFVGELRALLATSCIEALEPDLIILDEFQRFAHLLDGNDEGGRLARELFSFKGAAVLMLSATPYKMYTGADEADGEDHYRDFIRTVRFLERSEDAGAGVNELLAAYRKAMLATGEPGSEERLTTARSKLEERLRRVIVRTERLAATPDRNGMLIEKQGAPIALAQGDVQDYLALQRVSRVLDHPDTLEYWKSTAFVLNFMDEGYKLKRELDSAMEDPERRGALAKELSRAPGAVLRWDQVERYEELDPGNGRLRALIEDTVGTGAYRLLWLPPALPYYKLAGPFGAPSVQGFTKRLVFSAWRLVPRAIAACLSYEAERRMMGRTGNGTNTPEARRKHTPLLRFGRAEGRLTGMPVLALMYPSVYLARACDPARLARLSGDGVAGGDVTSLLREAESNIEVALRRLPSASSNDGPEDERWYWAAPLLLDRALDPGSTRRWFEQPNLAKIWAGGLDTEDTSGSTEPNAEGSAWEEHVAVACAFANDTGTDLGKIPSDLTQVLARIAIGAPGVTMLRAMLRVVGMKADALGEQAGVRVRNGAAQAASSFRGLFNQADVTAMLEGKAPYWRQVLDYCVDGCLQSVLDEYAHVLRDHLGVGEGNPGEKVHEIAEQICEAMSLRTANLGVSDLGLSDAGRTMRPQKRRMRCHFALRFGDERSEDGEVATRADSVRKAFNSPFWPFVVATTSVGQEGLDFHNYCHAVVHWNLPSNPVDLEQREGRVHRFKGHAVRKNVAQKHGVASIEDGSVDLWESMFQEAARGRPRDANDIVPFWVYATDGGARIERHVPSFSMSREVAQLQELSKSLAVYRMAFGQPRQDDLLRYLISRFGKDKLAQLLDAARIDLSPHEMRSPQVGQAAAPA